MHLLLKVLPPLVTTLFLSTAASAADAAKEIPSTNHLTLPAYQPMADRLIRAATETDFAYKRLAELCDTFGPRFSGSTNLEAAIDWVLARMNADGLDNVRGEEVRVPHWVRGDESIELLEPNSRKLAMLGLGGSVNTPPEGITAPVLVVRSFEELKKRGTDARGRIVVFNAPFTDYGQTVAYRAYGAIEAASLGAVAALVRSIAPASLQTPHTGMMLYTNTTPKIPCAAITSEDAEQFQRWQERGKAVVVRIKMSAKYLDDARSRNVIAELVGREHPEEIVLVSGHLDSWDVGQGAQDDGGGSVAAWEAVRLMRQLGLRPRRTVRVVLWTNEENGLQGAKGYAEKHRQELARHVLAMEADRGTFQPTGFTFRGSPTAQAAARQVASLLETIHADKITDGGSGADVEHVFPAGVPVMELTVEGSKYFWFHHTTADTVDKIDPGDLSQCAAAMAVMAYVIADLPAF